MIIHNTTYSVLPTSEETWVAWIKETHLRKIESLPGVKTCQFLKLLTEVESDGVTYTIQVELDNLPNGEAFLEKHDPLLQSEVLKEFPEQVIYFQTLLKIM